MLAVYKHLLRLYPASHRKEFSEEMFTAFCRLQADAVRSGFPRRVRFYLREGGGLLRGALSENWREFAKRRFDMRDEFRFPKSTWILMTIILAGVVMAIARGEAISVSVPPMNPELPPIHPARELLSNWGLSFLMMYAVGVIVGAILFVLRRSGALRLQKP
jgi:hypothetical protein